MVRSERDVSSERYTAHDVTTALREFAHVHGRVPAARDFLLADRENELPTYRTMMRIVNGGWRDVLDYAGLPAAPRSQLVFQLAQRLLDEDRLPENYRGFGGGYNLPSVPTLKKVFGSLGAARTAAADYCAVLDPSPSPDLRGRIIMDAGGQWLTEQLEQLDQEHVWRLRVDGWHEVSFYSPDLLEGQQRLSLGRDVVSKLVRPESFVSRTVGHRTGIVSYGVAGIALFRQPGDQLQYIRPRSL